MGLEVLNHQLENEKRKLEYLSSHDHLTGLYNRGSMEQVLKSEFSLVKRNQRHVCLMMIDIDFFKKINDNYGHTIGDQVLIHVAQTIKERLRSADIAFRYGGEEFLVLLPDTKIDQSLSLAKEINTQISRTPQPSLDNITLLSVLVLPVLRKRIKLMITLFQELMKHFINQKKRIVIV
jgi:diguanylate cyclase (GGDEF)-like protein